MSLRTSYTGTLDAKLAQAKQAGYDFVTVTNLGAITSDMAVAANQGKKIFTLNYSVSFQPDDLRLLGPLWQAFRTGIISGLASEDLMINEVVVSLNTSDSLSTSVDLNFNFCG